MLNCKNIDVMNMSGDDIRKTIIDALKVDNIKYEWKLSIGKFTPEY